MSKFKEAHLCAVFMLPLMLSIRLLLVVAGLAAVPVGVTWAMIRDRDTFPRFLWIWDNDEDGFTGDKRGWYSSYLYLEKANSLKVTGFRRWWRSVRWSMIRNPANNMQRAKWLSWSAENPEDVVIDYDGKAQEWVISFMPRGGALYHLCVNKKILGVRVRFGLKLKPWYYPEYGGKPIPIEKSRKRTTYTASIFFND